MRIASFGIVRSIRSQLSSYSIYQVKDCANDHGVVLVQLISSYVTVIEIETVLLQHWLNILKNIVENHCETLMSFPVWLTACFTRVGPGLIAWSCTAKNEHAVLDDTTRMSSSLGWDCSFSLDPGPFKALLKFTNHQFLVSCSSQLK